MRMTKMLLGVRSSTFSAKRGEKDKGKSKNDSKNFLRVIVCKYLEVIRKLIAVSVGEPGRLYSPKGDE